NKCNPIFRIFSSLAIRWQFRAQYRYFSNKSNKSNGGGWCFYFFGKRVLNDLLDNRKQRILSTIQNSEELCRATIGQVEKVRIRLQKVKLEADDVPIEVQYESLGTYHEIYAHYLIIGNRKK
uniref:Uncharacterized protein n=1 Tax=Aegilops tauschii subsp. strangulata TaxID=200361 RepID=A0A453C3W5_AEGTS